MGMKNLSRGQLVVPMMAVAVCCTAFASDLPWESLTGTEREPASSAEQTMQVPFLSWWYGFFMSGTIEFTSEPNGMWMFFN